MELTSMSPASAHPKELFMENATRSFGQKVPTESHVLVASIIENFTKSDENSAANLNLDVNLNELKKKSKRAKSINNKNPL
jgi:hypothetical protein